MVPASLASQRIFTHPAGSALRPVTRGFFSDDPNTFDNMADASKWIVVGVVVVALVVVTMWYVPRSAFPAR